MQRGQVDHVLCGVLQLVLAEWAAQPVRARLAFGQLDAGQLAHEFLVAEAGAQAGERCGNLGVEQLCDRARPGRERFEVLARAVHHADTRGIGEHGGEWRGIDLGRWVDQRDAAIDFDLHQRKARQEGVDAHEFGVESDRRRSALEQLRSASLRSIQSAKM